MSSEDIKIHSVAACCNNRGIGNKGLVPWDLPREYDYFTAVTIGNPPQGKRNVVIMGRKTWESIPTALEGRYNIVFSRTLKKSNKEPDAVVSSLEDFVTLLKSNEWKEKIGEIYNAGGTKLYEDVLESPCCGKIYLTRVYADFECDTFFPPLDDRFVSMPVEKFPEVCQQVQEEKGIKWKTEVYMKRSDVI